MELTDKSNCHVPKWHLMASLPPTGRNSFYRARFRFPQPSDLAIADGEVQISNGFSVGGARRVEILSFPRAFLLYLRAVRVLAISFAAAAAERAAFNVIFVFAAAALAGISENIVTCAPANCMSGVIASQSRTARIQTNTTRRQRERANFIKMYAAVRSRRRYGIWD
jgi:hypothetical protein